MPLHVLLSYATRRPYQETPNLPEGIVYDPVQGIWISNGEPLVHSDEFAKGPATKKCDQETGEDQKGE